MAADGGQGSGALQRDLRQPREALDFPVLQELKDEGYSDYLVLPLRFSDGSIKAASFASRSAAGFSPTELATLEALAPVLATVLEIQTLKRTATTLLDTYLGRQTGQRVLAGQVRRGDGENIHAVIWFCDLRGSTPLADALERQAFLDLLNEFLEAMAGAVLAHGGEVLRFIGDAALAIFPIESEAEPARCPLHRAACENALAAAREAARRVDQSNARRRAAGEPEIDFGIGLHLGDVAYGNIGAPERLEFTVIGTAANEAARLESLTKELAQPIVLSRTVAELIEDPLVSLGHHRLKGVAEPLEVFAPTPS